MFLTNRFFHYYILRGEAHANRQKFSYFGNIFLWIMSSPSFTEIVHVYLLWVKNSLSFLTRKKILMAKIQHPEASMVRNAMKNCVHDNESYIYLNHPNFWRLLFYECDSALAALNFRNFSPLICNEKVDLNNNLKILKPSSSKNECF